MCVRVYACMHTCYTKREVDGTGGSSAYHARWQDPATKRARVSPLDARRAQLARDSRSGSTLNAIAGVCGATTTGLFPLLCFDRQHGTRGKIGVDGRFRQTEAHFSMVCSMSRTSIHIVAELTKANARTRHLVRRRTRVSVARNVKDTTLLSRYTYSLPRVLSSL